MHPLYHPLKRAVLALCLLPALAFAQHGPEQGPPEGPRCDAPPPGGPHQRLSGMHGGGPLAGLDLDEAQQDKLFALDHEQQPQLRTLRRQADKSRRELAELGRSGQYSDAKAKQLADGLAHAESELALMRARFDSKVFALLTPEQRTRRAQPDCGSQAHGPRPR
jgi:Spy/CpxP family protein refolding chaperone